MSIKADHWIRRMAGDHKMIEPFAGESSPAGVISYGLSSYGYDMRLARQFKIPQMAKGGIIDPKLLSSQIFTDYEGASLVLEPGHFVLGRSVEYFRIPRNILTICYGKSTYARSGVLVNVTPFEPEWEGYVTIMITNCGAQPVRLYSDEGIAQVLFLESDEPCAVSYADKKGKYQQQTVVTPSRI